MASSTCPVVMGRQYCFERETKLVMKEEWAVTYGGFVIRDIYGKEWFEVKNKMFSNQIFDMEGNMVADLVKKNMAMRITFHLYTGEDMKDRRATLNLREWNCKKKVHVYMYDAPYLKREDSTNLDGMQPLLKIKAENRGASIKESKIFNGDSGEEYAVLSKSGAKEEVEGATGRTYLLTVKPGVDVALMCACAVLFNVVIKQEANN